jgi:hypothetical protein
MSGFGSRPSTYAAAAPAPAPSRPATTGLGSALYSANAGKAAANTYAANKAANAAAYNRTPQYAAGSTGSGSGGNVYNNYQYHTAPAYSPAPLVVHHYHDYGSGGHNFLWGYLLGHATAPQPVIVQQPAQVEYVQPQQQYVQQPQQYDPQPASVATQAGAQPNDSQPQAQAQAAQQGAANVAVPAQSQPHSHGFLRFLAWVAGIGAVAFLGWKLLSSWSARKSSYTSTNHYKL